MELIKKKVRMLKRKCEAVSQITFDEDLNVPDVKPDIGRMIQKKGDIQIEDIQISEGRAYITGALAVCLLYVSDSQERKIQSLMGTLRIGETLNLEGLENGDKVQLKWDIEDLSVQLIHSRKLPPMWKKCWRPPCPSAWRMRKFLRKNRRFPLWGRLYIKKTPCG